MLNGIDPNSPFIKQLAKTNPALLQQLGITPQTAPAPAQAPLTADMVRSIVDERMASLSAAQPAAKAQTTMAQLDQVFAKALSADDYNAFAEYLSAGSPGFNDLLAGDALNPIAQLLWETIKEHKK